MVIFPHVSIDGRTINQFFGHCHDRIVVAVSVSEAAEKGFRFNAELSEPVTRHQCAGIGIRIGKRKILALEVG